MQGKAEKILSFVIPGQPEGLGSELLLTSVEGTAHNRWPPSPPLQSLAIEERGEQTVALAVGMAGGAHWLLINVSAVAAECPSTK